MIDGRRLLSVWFALHLSVGIGLMGITSALFEQADIPLGAPVVVGAFGALMTAYVLLHQFPELESSEVWRFGFFTFVLFIIGNVPTPNGIYAPSGGDSPLMIGLLWIAAMAVSYRVVNKENPWHLNRLTSR